MKLVASVVALFLCPGPALALGTFRFDLPLFQVDAAFDLMSFSPRDLNDARKTIIWSGTTPAGGTFNSAIATSVSIGTSGLVPGYLSLQFNDAGQELPRTTIQGATYTAQDSFAIQTYYLLYDFPFETHDFFISLGGGVGFARKFELHQNINAGTWNEDSIWSGKPTPYKLRVTVAQTTKSENIRLFVRLQYEWIASELRAVDNYIANSVSNGDYFKDTQGRVITADLSGWRLGVGLAFVF